MKLNSCLLLILTLLGMVILTIPAFCFQSEYYLYISTGYSGNLPVLKVLPSGEIINTGYLYATGQHPTMGLISTQNLLIVSSAIPSNGEFVTYKFNRCSRIKTRA